MLLAVVLLGIALPASAHPVRIGRYAEIPYGIRRDHFYPTARGGPQREGRVRGRAPHEAPTQLWERTLRHRLPRGPAIARSGAIYLGTTGGLVALGPDGHERWSVRLGAVHSTPSLAPSDDIVVVTRGGLVAIVTPDGVTRHTADLGAPARGSPLVLDDGSVLIATIDRRVHRLDASLRRVFAVEVPEGSGATLTASRRGVFAVPTGRVLSLLDAEGRISRQLVLGGRVSSSLVVAPDGTMWVPTVEGLVQAIDPNGRIRSTTDLRSRNDERAAPAIGRDGALRFPTLTEGVVCIGPGGTERWRLANQAGYTAPASIDDEDTTLVVDRGGRLIAIAADGTERWHVVLGTYTYQSPVLGPDSTIYIATERGTLQAWR